MGFLITLVTLLPTILQFILQIEAAFKNLPVPPGIKMGDVKKQILMDTVTTATTDKKTIAAVSKITDNTVKLLNDKTLFTHDSTEVVKV